MIHRPMGLRATTLRSLEAVKRFWPELRREWRLASFALLAMLAEVGLRLAEPWPLKWVIDHLLSPYPTDTGGGPAGGLSTQQALGLAALSLALVVALRSLSSYWSAMGFAVVGNRVLTRVRAKLYNHLQRLSLGFHHKERTGDLVQRVVGDVGLLKDVAVTAALPLFGRTLVMLTMVGVMLWLNWRLTLVVFLVLPLFSLRTLKLTRGIRQASRLQRHREGAIAATATESLGAIGAVQALSMQERFAGAFSAQSQKSLGEGIKTKRLSLKMERTVDVAVGLAMAIVLWYGAVLALRGALTTGELVVFLHYLKGALKPAKDFSKYTARIAKATAAAERVLEVMDQEPAVQDQPHAAPAPPLEGRINLCDVEFSYEPEKPLFRELNLSIEPRQTVALVGPSGSGKSTVASLILRLYDPLDGTVFLDGRDIRSFTLDSVRSQVGMVLQDPVLFAVSVRENIAAGLSSKSAAEIEAAARLANAHAFIQQLPRKYDTLVGERGITLSQGQRQRIAIARAVLARSPILILDEPTSGLDNQNSQAVVEAVRRLSGRCTIVLITHDLTQAALAERIYYLDRGQIAEQGNHSELVERDGAYARLWHTQSAVSVDSWPSLASGHLRLQTGGA